LITIENSSINQMLAHELMKNIQAFSTSMERMASGLKINSAKDDPSGFYLSSRFTTQINGLTVANNNIQNAIDILGQADESLKEIDELLGKMRDLIESSCSEYLTPSEREENQKKINAYFQQALQIKDETEVDGRKIFSEKISLDKNVTYTDGHAVTEAGNALAASFVDDSTPAAQPASMPVVDSGTDSGVDNGVAAADFVDTGMAAYSPEDEWGAVYSPEDDYGSLYDESAYSDDEEETAFVFDDGVQNAGIAMADTEGDGIACYSGEEDPNAGISIASETGNDGIAVASTIVDSGSIEVTSTSQPITIGDKMYDVHGSGTLSWAVDDTGQITFQSSSTNDIYIDSHADQEDNVIIDGCIYFNAEDGDDYIGVINSTGVYGGSGNDTIEIFKNAYVGTVAGGDGNDLITAEEIDYSYMIQGDDGDDTISVILSTTGYFTVSGGEGNDSITIDSVDDNYSKSIRNVYGDGGSDYIYVNATTGYISGGADNDTIINESGVSDLYGEQGDDSIVNNGWVVNSIFGQDGNDSIVNNRESYFISADEGNDTIINNAGGTINGATLGAGDDVLYNFGNIENTDRAIYGGDGTSDDSTNDALYVGANSSIGGYNAEEIQEKIGSRPIEGIEIVGIKDGAQTITIADDETKTIEIDGKKYDVENMTPSGTSATLTYSLENGQIKFTSNDTLQITAHADQEDNVIIDGFIYFNAGDGDDYIGVINSTGVYGGSGNDTIEIFKNAYVSTVEGGDGNDLITAAEGIDYSNMIQGNDGDDTISVILSSTGYFTVSGGEGNDSITIDSVDDNYSKGISNVYGDGGSDYIYVNATTGYIYGGADNDTIINESQAYNLSGEQGDDSIVNNGRVDNSIFGQDGNDYVINKGAITSNPGAINLGAGNDTFYDYSDGHLKELNAGDGDDYLYIYSDGNHINGYHGNDYIYIHGDDNHANGFDGDDMIFVYSDGNEITGGGGSDDIMISGDNNIAYGQHSTAIGNDFNTITTSGKNNTYSGFDELNNGNQSMNIQTDWNINDYSSYTLNLDLFLPEIEFDISTAENAQLSLTQLDEIIKGLSNSRTSIGAQNLVLEEQLSHNTIRMSNIENSRSIIRDADTAEEYNNLITQASMVQQIQTLQAQANSNHYNLVSQLIYGVVA